MRPRDAGVALSEALAAGEAVARFIGDMTLGEYRANEVVVSAVERQFEILGEAMSRALRAEPGLVDRVPETPAVIGFRNVLAHDYEVVADETVYQNATIGLPVLLAKVRCVLNEMERS
jgi:uncharacterized protein with HEPN domain